jgi:hypothetical protein
MSDFDFHVGVDGDLIVVTDPVTRYYAIYTRPSDRAETLAHGDTPHLTLVRRRPTKNCLLLKEAYKAASAKARELGWIV